MQNQVTVNLGHQILSGNLRSISFSHHQFKQADITVNFSQGTATDRADRHKEFSRLIMIEITQEQDLTLNAFGGCARKNFHLGQGDSLTLLFAYCSMWIFF